MLVSFFFSSNVISILVSFFYSLVFLFQFYFVLDLFLLHFSTLNIIFFSLTFLLLVHFPFFLHLYSRFSFVVLFSFNEQFFQLEKEWNEFIQVEQKKELLHLFANIFFDLTFFADVLILVSVFILHFVDKNAPFWVVFSTVVEVCLVQ